MHLGRFLKEESVKLALESRLEPPPEPDNGEEVEEESEAVRARRHWRLKEAVLGELVELLDASGKVQNKKRLLEDMINRERKATTGVGRGIAIPHVRTIQTREFVMAVGIAPEGGLPFDAVDGEPVRLFICLAAPPFDDRTYLKVYRILGELFGQGDGALEDLLHAQVPGEVIRTLSRIQA